MDLAALALVVLVLATTYGIGYWRGLAQNRPRLGLGTSERPRARAEVQGLEAFTVVSLMGDLLYGGSSGGDARRTIERLRSDGVEWEAYRAGKVWDWGPRE